MSGAAASRVTASGVATQLRAWRCIVSTELTVVTVSWCTGGVMSTELAPAHHCTMQCIQTSDQITVISLCDNMTE